MEVGFEREAVAVLSVSLADIVAAKSRIRRDTVLGAGAVLVIAVLVYSFIVGRITRPIRDLSRITRTVDVDDLGPAIQVDSRDEVGELGASYNSMIRRLQENRRELERLHREELERTDRLATIGEMAAGIAHEVRNPLAGISGAIQVLVRVDDLGEEKREILEETLNQIDRLDKLVGDLLAYSRPSAPTLEPANLNEILEKSIFVLNLGSGKSEVRIDQHLDDRIAEVPADPEQVQQVFLNILLNAIQSIPGDGVVRVETAPAQRDGRDEVVVRIRDNGVGMSPETMEKALQPFFTTKSRGTGLGLSIARQILENHRATLQVSSVQGEGTEFTISFPVGDVGPDPGRSQSP
jgi:signal transduction histidine kinase